MDRSTRHHTAEALKAQIWFLVVWNAVMLPLILTSGDGAEPPVWVWFGPLLEFLAGVSTVGLAIRGAVQASRGNWWRYPLPFRVVPGSLPKKDDPSRSGERPRGGVLPYAHPKDHRIRMSGRPLIAMKVSLDSGTTKVIRGRPGRLTYGFVSGSGDRDGSSAIGQSDQRNVSVGVLRPKRIVGWARSRKPSDV